MIPNFKTYINESVWSDIHKRSNGKSTRKEDDIELLDMFGLYEYILANYELTDNRFEMTYGTENMAIYVSSYGDEILLTYKFGEVHCFFNLSRPLYNELSKLFYIKRSEEKHYIIFPKKDVTNKFYIDVLDCIIANKSACILKRKENVSESVWSDIHHRSNGKIVRKEDDIDLMSAEELYNYIKDTYLFKSTSDIFIDEKRDRIVINLYDVAGGRESYLSLNGYDEKYIILSDLYTKHMRDLLDAYYHVGERSFRNPSLDDFIIRPKDDGEITNKFFIEVLDFLIDNADNTHQPNLYPANKFRKNESIWSDIHHRSNGTSIRKEDDINNLDYKEFFDYIYVNYWPTEFNNGEIIHQFPSYSKSEIWKIQIPVEVHIKGSSHEITPPITINANKSTGKLVSLLLSSDLTKTYPEILDICEFDHDKFHIPHIVRQKGELTNQFCVDVIDKILSIVKKPLFYRKTHK